MTLESRINELVENYPHFECIVFKTLMCNPDGETLRELHPIVPNSCARWPQQDLQFMVVTNPDTREDMQTLSPSVDLKEKIHLLIEEAADAERLTSPSTYIRYYTKE